MVRVVVVVRLHRAGGHHRGWRWSIREGSRA